MRETVRKASTSSDVNDAKKEIERGLGQPLATYLKGDKALSLKDYFWERLYAHTLVLYQKRNLGEREMESVHEGVRAFHFLEILAGQKDNEKPLTWAELSRVTL